MAGQRIRDVERGGHDLSREEKDEIRDRFFKRLLEDRTKRLRERIKELEDEISADFKRRGQEGQVAARQFQPANALQRPVQPTAAQPNQTQSNAAQQKQVQIVEDIKSAVDRMEQLAISVASSLDGVALALIGSERAIVNAGGRRT